MTKRNKNRKMSPDEQHRPDKRSRVGREDGKFSNKPVYKIDFDCTGSNCTGFFGHRKNPCIRLFSIAVLLTTCISLVAITSLLIA